MFHTDTLMGMPWQLAKLRLQAACIPYKVIIGGNFNRFFSVEKDGYYVARVKPDQDGIIVVVYPPMIHSHFSEHTEVAYAETDL